MSTNSTIAQKSNGAFALSNQFFAESSWTTIGNQAALGLNRDRRSTTSTEAFAERGIQFRSSDVNIAGLRLEIDGDDNAVILGEGVKLNNRRIQIHGDREAWNFRG